MLGETGHLPYNWDKAWKTCQGICLVLDTSHCINLATFLVAASTGGLGSPYKDLSVGIEWEVIDMIGWAEEQNAMNGEKPRGSGKYVMKKF
jgi:hypothetical protein